VEPLRKKDSLHITDTDRRLIVKKVKASARGRIFDPFKLCKSTQIDPFEAI
jgi:hypothetical protein